MKSWLIPWEDLFATGRKCQTQSFPCTLIKDPGWLGENDSKGLKTRKGERITDNTDNLKAISISQSKLLSSFSGTHDQRQEEINQTPGIPTSLQQHKALPQTKLWEFLHHFSIATNRSCGFTNRIHFPVCGYTGKRESSAKSLWQYTSQEWIQSIMKPQKKSQDHSNCIYLKQLLPSSSAWN